MTILTRDATPADETFLRDLIVSHIAIELGADLWPEALRTQLTGMQCDARRQAIRANFPDAPEQVIEIDGHRAGWLVLAESDARLHLVEILIAPEWRRTGAGSAILSRICERARASGKSVCLQVEVRNTAAIRLYRRAGFHHTGDDAVRHFMEFTPR
jgi:ribosomal protein S18 acetylase RimI-like enzyme